MRKALIITATLALLMAGTASAHFGNIWFQTRAEMEYAIEDKYQIGAASCRPKTEGPVPGHWIRDNAWSIKRWDHFVCGVYSEVTNRTCVVLAHQTGGQWDKIVLTGYKGAKGTTCIPRDLRRR